MPAFSVATNGDLVWFDEEFPAAITRLGVAAGPVVKAWGTGIFLLYPLPIKRVATKTAAQVIE